MKKTVIANLKMNFTKDEMTGYISEITNKISDNLNVIICPSNIYLSMLSGCGYKIGAQNSFYLDKGSYTGETSPLQLKSLGVSYIIVGHSERRVNLGEDDLLIGKKISAILKQNIKVILCIGETLAEKQLKKTTNILKNQLLIALKDIPSDAISDIVIAYEPVWAIGSGKIPPSDEIKDVAILVKDVINKKYDVDVKVLYGGSVDKTNIEQIISIKGIDGLLVGSSSLNAKYFVEMLDLID